MAIPKKCTLLTLLCVSDQGSCMTAKNTCWKENAGKLSVCVQAGPNRSGIITGFRIVLNESGVGRGKRHPDTINGEIKFKTLLKPCNMLAAECGGM